MKARLLKNILFVSLLIALFISIGESPACYTNQYPVAILTAEPVYVTVGEEVTFDGSDSYDQDGYITKWELDPEGDGYYQYVETYPTGDGIFPHTYDIADAYTANLRVTDNQGAQKTCTFDVFVRQMSCNPERILPLRDEVMTITYVLAENANVTIVIYEAIDGDPNDPFITLVDNVPTQAGSHEVIWYGMNGPPSNPNSRYVSDEGLFTVEMKVDGVVTDVQDIWVYK